jgi:hypothetical protein
MPPALVLAIILGSLYGLIFFLFLGGNRRNFLYYWLVGVLGFLAGQFVAEYVQVSSFMVGDVHIVEASLVCCFALLVLYARGERKRPRPGGTQT